ncbi:serum response factor-like isoform X1 [Petromyzon marinus]|uniref:Serum response factor n=1 Tax=Petromyzon marinus TaxID=7757 RepID=A0AAJ7X4N1_PETMA|nr:serum response factor-like isoform X1 [Petromyzon marinus]
MQGGADQEMSADSDAESEGSGVVAGSSQAGEVALKPGKKTRGRVKIKMAFIDNKLRRYTTFSKRKTGIMKKAYELSTLTGTQVLLLVASETGHVYTFATRKLQPMITSESGKALIQTCLNSPDSPPRTDSGTQQRMSATGFEETELIYQVADGETSSADVKHETTAKASLVTISNIPGAVTSGQSAGGAATSVQFGSSTAFPITSYMAPVLGTHTSSSASSSGTSKGGNQGVCQSSSVLPNAITLMPGTILPPGTPIGSLPQQLTLPGPPSCGGQHTVFRFPGSSAAQILSIETNGVAQQMPLQAIQIQPGHVTLQPTNGHVNLQPTSQTAAAVAASSSTFTVVESPPTVSMAALVPTTCATTVGGHVMYPHGVMYATSSEGLTLLNAFNAHSAGTHEQGIPQVVLTSSGTALQIPVNSLQLQQLSTLSQSQTSSSPSPAEGKSSGE